MLDHRHIHIGRSAADHTHVATCHSASPTLIKLLLSLLIVDCSFTRHADDALLVCQVLSRSPFLCVVSVISMMCKKQKKKGT